MINDDEQHYLIPESGDVESLPDGITYVIGRHSDSDLVVRVEDVSRRHAEIHWEGDPVQPVLHAHGRHGTHVNGRALEVGQAITLRSRDEVRLGEEYRVCYLLGTTEELRRFVLEREQQLTGQHRTRRERSDSRSIRLAQEQVANLTPRERQVSRLAITGLSNGEIAHELEISLSTVKLHLRNAFAKTGTQGRTELTAYLLGGDAPPWQE